MSNALDNVLNQAQAAANNFTPATPDNLPATQPTYAGGGLPAKQSLSDVADAAGMQVDEYLQLKAEGMRIGEMKGLIDELIVEMDMQDIVPAISIRGEQGGATKFIKSYDGGRTTSTGENWALAEQNLRRQYGKVAGPYPTADIPFTLLSDVKDPKTSLVFDEGTVVGLTPSMTGFKPFQKFLKTLKKNDPSLFEQTITVKLTHRKRTNSNNNEWGVVEFEHVVN